MVYHMVCNLVIFVVVVILGFLILAVAIGGVFLEHLITKRHS